MPTFTVPRAQQSPNWPQADLHVRLFTDQPELYALCAVAPGVSDHGRAQALFLLLASPRQGFPTQLCRLLDRVVANLLARLPRDMVLTAFLALRRARINRKPARWAILRYLLNHPALCRMVVERRPTVVDLLEHALGRNVARACLRKLAAGEPNRYTRQRLLRHASNPDAFVTIVPYLCGQGPAPVLAPSPEAPEASEPPRTVTATNRGQLAAILWHLLRGEPTAPLETILARVLHDTVDSLPRFEGRLGVVVDLSASMRGYGDREHCLSAQAVALQLVFERVAAEACVVTVGGRGFPPQAVGPTDLATAVLAVAADQPDVIAVITDGYENVERGDLADVCAALPEVGVHSTVAICTCMFTAGDDLTHRRPAPRQPHLPFWHQDDFRQLIIQLCALAPGPRGAQLLTAALHTELAREVTPCFTH